MLIIIVISVNGFVKCCILNAVHHVTILGIHEVTLLSVSRSALPRRVAFCLSGLPS